jgi:hypothetical protein
MSCSGDSGNGGGDNGGDDDKNDEDDDDDNGGDGSGDTAMAVGTDTDNNQLKGAAEELLHSVV